MQSSRKKLKPKVDEIIQTPKKVAKHKQKRRKRKSQSPDKALNF